MKKTITLIYLISTIISNAQCWNVVASGYNTSYGIDSNGSLWAWGKNNVGQLGDNTTTNSSTPIQIGSVNEWGYIATNGFTTVGIKSDNTLWAWGRGTTNLIPEYGSDQYVPVQIITGTLFTDVSVGWDFCIAVDITGKLWYWGGALGVAPFIMSADSWEVISAGQYHFLAIKSDSTLWGYGSNVFGQLGNGTNTNLSTLSQIGVESNWGYVKTSYSHTLGYKMDNTVWAWGSNGNGELADGTTTNRNFPSQIGIGTSWNSLYAYGNTASVSTDFWKPYTILVDINGNVYGAGQYDFGTVSSLTLIPNLSNIQYADGGRQHRIFATNDNVIYGWKSNNEGQLANSSISYLEDPTIINCPSLSNQSHAIQKPTFSPNPTNSQITFSQEIFNLEVFDITGKKVKSFQNTNTSFDVAGLEKGIYFLKGKTVEGNEFNEKLIKE